MYLLNKTGHQANLDSAKGRILDLQKQFLLMHLFSAFLAGPFASTRFACGLLPMKEDIRDDMEAPGNSSLPKWWRRWIRRHID